MISAVLLVPAAPWLIPSVAPPLSAAQTTLRGAVQDLIGATEVDRWAALGVAPTRSRPRWDQDVPMELGRDPYRGGGAASALPGSYWVARALLGSVPLAAGSLAPPDGDGAPVRAGLRDLVADPRSHALLVTADGSAAHGEHAPGAPDERAAGYDAALQAALAGGPTGTRAWLGSAAGSLALAAELGATMPAALRVVLEVLDEDPTDGAAQWTAGARDVCAPHGVGHHVARWVRR